MFFINLPPYFQGMVRGHLCQIGRIVYLLVEKRICSDDRPREDRLQGFLGIGIKNNIKVLDVG